MRLTKHLGKVSASSMIKYNFILIITFIGFTTTQAKFVSYQILSQFKSLKEKIKICDPGDKLYI